MLLKMENLNSIAIYPIAAELFHFRPSMEGKPTSQLTHIAIITAILLALPKKLAVPKLWLLVD